MRSIHMCVSHDVFTVKKKESATISFCRSQIYTTFVIIFQIHCYHWATLTETENEEPSKSLNSLSILTTILYTASLEPV